MIDVIVFANPLFLCRTKCCFSVSLLCIDCNSFTVEIQTLYFLDYFLVLKYFPALIISLIFGAIQINNSWTLNNSWVPYA